MQSCCVFCVCFFVYRNHPVCLSVHISPNSNFSGNFSLRHEPILIKLVVFNLRMCTNEDNLGSNYFKGDNIFLEFSEMNSSVWNQPMALVSTLKEERSCKVYVSLSI